MFNKILPIKKKIKTLQDRELCTKKLPRIFNKLTGKKAFQARKLFENFEKWTPDPLKTENYSSVLLLRMSDTDQYPRHTP